MEIVSADIGGTHARFAIAEITEGRVVRLRSEMVLSTADFASLQGAWARFEEHVGAPLPRAASMAWAGPIGGEILKLTNNPWMVRRQELRESLGLDQMVLLNDFAAIGHAVIQCEEASYAHLLGPALQRPRADIVTLIGPGTGLGVAQVDFSAARPHVRATEAGHVAFAPLDKIEDGILAHLRAQHARVSIERIVSGPGLAAIYEALSVIENLPAPQMDQKTLWERALKGDDILASHAIERFIMCFGAFAGDLVLAHGASCLVIAGSLGRRLSRSLASSNFATRFVSKGRFEAMMRTVPVLLLTHPEPGLFGAAVAFTTEQRI